MSRTRALEEGNLTKLGFKSGKWQKRWFELRCEEQCDPELLYFSTKGSTTERGCIALDSFTECHLAEPDSCPSADALSPGVVVRKGIPEHCLLVTAPWEGSSRRTFYLAAENAESMQSWKISIQQSVKLATDDDGKGAHTGAGTAMVGLAAALRGQQLQDEELTEADQAYSPPLPEDGDVDVDVDGFVDLGNARALQGNGANLTAPSADGAGDGGEGGGAATNTNIDAEDSAVGGSGGGFIVPAPTISPARPIPQMPKARATGGELAASWDSAGEPTIVDRFVDMIVNEFGGSPQSRRKRPESPPITDPF